MTIRYLVAVFAFFVAMMSQPNGFSQDRPLLCSSVDTLMKSGFSKDVSSVICDIKSKNYPIPVLVYTDDKKFMAEIYNGEILMFVLNSRGVYTPFAATQ